MARTVRRVFLLPIEPFDERYTEQWYRWWRDELAAFDEVEVVVVDGEPVGERRSGQFLDVVDTWVWKGTQAANLARHFQRREVRDGDWILLLDFWGPATTAALYMRDLMGLRGRVGIAAFAHAGAFDPHDYLARTGLTRWALDVERGWVRGVDLVLCGSRWARSLIADHLFDGDPAEVRHVVPTGNPVHQREVLALAGRLVQVPWDARPRKVVFPHRLSPEKDPDFFRRVEEEYRDRWGDDAVWVRTRDGYTGDKRRDYYGRMADARVVFSSAHQETFGIAMQEGVALGAWAVAPNRCSYPEVISPTTGFLYEPDDVGGAAFCVRMALERDTCARFDAYHEDAITRAAVFLRHHPADALRVLHVVGSGS